MAVLALVLIVVWLLLVAIVRSVVQHRRTGDAPAAFRDRRGSPQWAARVISSVGFVLLIAAPIAELAGLPRIAPLDHPAVGVVGVALGVAGIATTMAAQWAMGTSWRADVDESARTALVTDGPFRIVRNPILSSTAATVFGFALMVPNIVSAIMLVAVVTAMQIQVRLVEEPYLLRVHGDAYRAYAARTGRFAPWIGRRPARKTPR